MLSCLRASAMGTCTCRWVRIWVTLQQLHGTCGIDPWIPEVLSAHKPVFPCLAAKLELVRKHADMRTRLSCEYLCVPVGADFWSQLLQLLRPLDI